MVRLLVVLSLIVLSGVSYAQIIAENFRNTDCANCKVPDDQYEAFIAANPSYEVILVNYHSSFPSPQDPFYLASKDDVNPRNNIFYGIISNPFMYVGGYSAGSKVSDWKTLTQEAAAITSPLTVTLEKSIANNIITIHATVNGSSSMQVRPFALILESDIVYNNTLSYGNPPSGKWNDIVRAIAPTPNGDEPVLISGTKHFIYEYDATGKGWNLNNIHLVFFLQQVTKVTPGNNYPILGVGKTEFTKSVKKAKEFEGYSLEHRGVNPFTGKNYMKMNLKQPAQVKILISDILGNTVATALDEFISSSEYGTDLNMQGLNEGVYFARMFVGNQQVDVVKIDNLLPLLSR